MKTAVLIQCHKSPEQINLLLDTMKHECIDFFIHADLKSDILNEIVSREDVIKLPDDMRVDVQWGRYSIVQSTLNLVEYAARFGHYDYYCLLSGQDFPVVSSDELIQYLQDNAGKNFVNLFESKNSGLTHTNNYDKRNEIIFPEWLMKRKLAIRIIRRLWVIITGGYNHTYGIFKRKQPQELSFYFGSAWWCLHTDFVDWINHYLKENRSYEAFYKLSSCPDESFFQTLLMNSPYADTREEYLHYIDWSEGKSSPKNLTCEDFDKIVESGKLFARKIDNDYRLINMLTEYLNR